MPYLDSNRDKLCRAFAVSNDQLGQINRERSQLLLEDLIRLLVCLLIDLIRIVSSTVRSSSTVREDQNRIISRHIPVNTDGIEASVDSVGQRALEAPGRDSCVCHDAPQERRVELRAYRRAHVGVDHPSALVHPCHPVLHAFDVENTRSKLGERVRRHESPCSALPGVEIVV